MKKLLLSFAFLASGLCAFAQTVPLNQNWYVAPTAATAVTTTNSTMAYHNGKLYVADRNNKIYIVDPSNGSWNASNILFTDPLWTEGNKYTKIRVASDGAIYAVAMGLVSAGSANLYVYKWDSDTDVTPTRSVINVPKRVGESLAVRGTGASAVLYVSGATNNTIYRCTTTDGNTFTLDKTIVVNATTDNYARGSISPISDTEFIINGPSSVGIRKITIDPAAGTVTNTTSLFGTLDVALANAEYFEDGAKKYLVLSGGVLGSTIPSPLTNNNAVKIKVYDITSTPKLVAENALFSSYQAGIVANTNQNGYADVAVRKNVDGSHTFFHVVHGHGLASYTTAGTLPVSLTSFNAALLKGQSTLTWETASETNNKGFEVLRSIDGKEFTKIDFVNAKGQNGNSSTALSYTYVDRTAKAGVNYYKLNQVDLDGKTELFKDVKSVNVSLAGGVIVFPNPATTYVSVNAGSADFKGVKYEFFDASGKKVLSESAKAEQQDISLGKLPASVYYLKISKDNVVQNTVKLIKQ